MMLLSRQHNLSLDDFCSACQNNGHQVIYPHPVDHTRQIFFFSGNVIVQERPTFTHLEVSDDLSFLVCADGACNIYLVNLDDYFEDFPSQLVNPVCSTRGSSVGSLKFRYESGDEDSVARDVEMLGVAYGDRVWKTELLAFRRDAKQACLRNISGETDI